MIFKPIEAIVAADVEAMVADGAGEGRTLEFKESLPKKENPDERKKFLFGVASFANTIGGDIVYGVAEVREGGRKTGKYQVKGLEPGFNFDQERLRLNDMILRGIEPRLNQVEFKLLDRPESGPLVLVRVPRSLDTPHMVSADEVNKFFARNSGGRFLLGLPEIRAMFLNSQLLQDRIREFRSDRVARIAAGDTPALLVPWAKLILHVVPYSAFDRQSSIDLKQAYAQRGMLEVMGARLSGSRFNLDGFVLYGGSNTASQGYDSYTQVYRTGIVEAVDARTLEGDRENSSRGAHAIPSLIMENEATQALDSYLKVLRELGVEPPIAVFLSLDGVHHLRLATGAYSGQSNIRFDRPQISLPEAIVEDRDATAEDILEPIFEMVWQAAGHERNLTYDQAGKRKR